MLKKPLTAEIFCLISAYYSERLKQKNATGGSGCKNIDASEHKPELRNFTYLKEILMPDLGDLATIERPSLLMRAAKILVQNRDGQGKAEKRLSNAALDHIVRREAALEELRQTSPALYRADKHIELLATLIEQARLLMKRGISQI